MNSSLSVKEVLKTSFHILITNKWYIFKTFSISFLVQLTIFIFIFGGQFIIRYFFGNADILANGLFIIVVVLWFIFVVFNIQIGVMRVFLGLVDGKRLPIKNLINNIRILWPFFVTTLVIGFIELVGFVLFIIPGIYFIVKYAFALFALIDPSLNLQWENSLDYSSQLTRKRIIKILSIFAAAIIIPVLLGYALSALIGVFGVLDFVPILLRWLLVIALGFVVLLINIFSGVYVQLVMFVTYRRLQALQNLQSPAVPPANTLPTPQPEPLITPTPNTSV